MFRITEYLYNGTVVNHNKESFDFDFYNEYFESNPEVKSFMVQFHDVNGVLQEEIFYR